MERIKQLDLLSQREAITSLIDVKLWDPGTFLRMDNLAGHPQAIKLFVDYSRELSIYVKGDCKGWDEFNAACREILQLHQGGIEISETSVRTLHQNMTRFSRGGEFSKPSVSLKGWEDPFPLVGSLQTVEPPKDTPIRMTERGWHAPRTYPYVIRSLDDGIWRMLSGYDWEPLIDSQQGEDKGFDLFPFGTYEGRQYHLILRNLATATITWGHNPKNSTPSGKLVEDINDTRIPQTPEIQIPLLSFIERSGWVPVDKYSMTWVNPKAIALTGRFRPEKVVDEEGLVIMSTRTVRCGRTLYRCSGEALEQL